MVIIHILNLLQKQGEVKEFFDRYRGWLPSLERIFKKIREERGEIKDALKGFRNSAEIGHFKELLLEIGDESFYLIALASGLSLSLGDILPPDEQVEPIQTLSKKTYHEIRGHLTDIKDIRKDIKKKIITLPLSPDETKTLKTDIEVIFSRLSAVAGLLGDNLEHCIQLTIDKKIAAAKKKAIAALANIESDKNTVNHS